VADHTTVCKSGLEKTVTIAENSLLWGGIIQWAIPFNKGTLPSMGDSDICLPRDKKFGLTPLEQSVVYGGLQEIY